LGAREIREANILRGVVDALKGAIRFQRGKIQHSNG